jgi:hypothetical protein
MRLTSGRPRVNRHCRRLEETTARVCVAYSPNESIQINELE